MITPPSEHGGIVQRVADQYGISLDDPELKSKVQAHLDKEFEKWLDDHEDEAIENGKKYIRHIKALADHIGIEVKTFERILRQYEDTVSLDDDDIVKKVSDIMDYEGKELCVRTMEEMILRGDYDDDPET